MQQLPEVMHNSYFNSSNTSSPFGSFENRGVNVSSAAFSIRPPPFAPALIPPAPSPNSFVPPNSNSYRPAFVESQRFGGLRPPAPRAQFRPPVGEVNRPSVWNVNVNVPPPPVNTKVPPPPVNVNVPAPPAFAIVNMPPAATLPVSANIPPPQFNPCVPPPPILTTNCPPPAAAASPRALLGGRDRRWTSSLGGPRPQIAAERLFVSNSEQRIPMRARNESSTGGLAARHRSGVQLACCPVSVDGGISSPLFSVTGVSKSSSSAGIADQCHEVVSSAANDISGCSSTDATANGFVSHGRRRKRCRTSNYVTVSCFIFFYLL